MNYEALIYRRKLVDNLCSMKSDDFRKVYNKIRFSEVLEIEDAFMYNAIRYFAFGFHQFNEDSRQTKDHFSCWLINVVC